MAQAFVMNSQYNRRIQNLATRISDKFWETAENFYEGSGGFSRVLMTQLVIMLQIRAINIGLTTFSNDGKVKSTGGVLFYVLGRIFWNQIAPLTLAISSYHWEWDRSIHRILQDDSWVCAVTLSVLESFHRFFLLLLLATPDAAYSSIGLPESDISEEVDDQKTVSWVTLFIIVHTSRITARLTFQSFYKIVQAVVDNLLDGDDEGELEFDDDGHDLDNNEILVLDENNNFVLQFLLP